MRLNWKFVEQLAPQAKSYKELAQILNLTCTKSFRGLCQSHNILFGPIRRKSRISEEEWERRRQIGKTCTSWMEYHAKAGVKNYEPSLQKRHGVKILCYRCKTNFTDTTIRIGLYVRCICNDCKGKIRVTPKQQRNPLMSRLGRMQIDGEDTIENVSNLIACSISHQSEIEAKKLYDQAKELQDKIDECPNYEGCYHCWLLNEQSEELTKKADAIIKQRDPDNPFEDPAFIQKILDYDEA